MRVRVLRHEVTQPDDPSYRLIPLTQGKTAIVDTEDYGWLNKFNWFCHKTDLNEHYAVRANSGSARLPHLLFMHKEILGCSRGQQVDHIDRNPLNNRRDNLRKCTCAENIRNRGKAKSTTGPYKGIFIQAGRWRAKITYNRKSIHLGYFLDPLDAAKAYDKAARELFGEFACLNFTEP
jgi:hypothetical protein